MVRIDLAMVKRIKSVMKIMLYLCFQAIFGYLLFGEELSVRWWLGTVLIVSGIALMGGGGGKSEKTD